MAVQYDGAGAKTRARRKPRAEWLALQLGAHEGCIAWERAEAIRKMLSDNVPRPPTAMARPSKGPPYCRVCCAAAAAAASSPSSIPAQNTISPRYVCDRGRLDYGEPTCIAFGGLRVDDAVEAALLTVVRPAAVQAAQAAEALVAMRRDDAREALTRDLQAARDDAERAFRQYDASDPENRFVAGELETRWNRALTRVAEIDKRIAEHAADAPRQSDLAPISFVALADDLEAVWSAPATDVRIKKRIVRTVIHEAIADLDDAAAEIVIVIHGMDGAQTEHRLPRRRRGQRNATPADNVEAVGILALVAHDDAIAFYGRRHRRWERDHAG